MHTKIICKIDSWKLILPKIFGKCIREIILFQKMVEMDLITDSDTIMNYTQDISAYIVSIKYLLISRVINIKGNI